MGMFNVQVIAACHSVLQLLPSELLVFVASPSHSGREAI